MPETDSATRADRETSPTAAEQDRLLKEYELNVGLLRHDDDLRQKRTGNFLTVNSVLVVGLGTLVTIRPSFARGTQAVLLLATFGLLLCGVWYFVQVRNSEYVRFRRAMLLSIENRLPPLHTFTATHAIFYEHRGLLLPALDRVFALRGVGRFSSTRVENRLPFLMAMIWLSVDLVTLTLLLVRAT